jgi:hypothetical protein
MAKFSWNELQAFNLAAEGYLQKNPAETKTRYAIDRVRKQITSYQQKIQDAFVDLEIDNCVVDDKGVITRDPAGNLQFTREGIKARNQQQRVLLERRDLEIDPHYLAAVPQELTPFEQEAFAGLILHEAEKIPLKEKSVISIK